MGCFKKKATASLFQPAPGTGEDIKWHTLETTADIYRHAGVTARGLSPEEAEARIVKYGKNTMTPPNRKNFLQRLWDQLYNILIILLIICAIISAAFQEYADLGLIIAVIVINVAIGLIQEGKAEKAAEAIKKMLSSTAQVMRNGARTTINAENVSKRAYSCTYSTHLVCPSPNAGRAG